MTMTMAAITIANGRHEDDNGNDHRDNIVCQRFNLWWCAGQRLFVVRSILHPWAVPMSVGWPMLRVDLDSLLKSDFGWNGRVSCRCVINLFEVIWFVLVFVDAFKYILGVARQCGVGRGDLHAVVGDFRSFFGGVACAMLNSFELAARFGQRIMSVQSWLQCAIQRCRWHLDVPDSDSTVVISVFSLGVEHVAGSCDDVQCFGTAPGGSIQRFFLPLVWAHHSCEILWPSSGRV